MGSDKFSDRAATAMKKEAGIEVKSAEVQGLPIQPVLTSPVPTSPMPHEIQKADGVRGTDSNPVTKDGNFSNPDQQLVSKGDVVVSENAFTKELQLLHDQIEALTVEYTTGGMQFTDFPESYHNLTNQYRIMAGRLNSVVGGVGLEETKVLKEISETNTRLALKLEEARKRDTSNTEERKTTNLVKSKGVA